MVDAPSVANVRIGAKLIVVVRLNLHATVVGLRKLILGRDGCCMCAYAGMANANGWRFSNDPVRANSPELKEPITHDQAARNRA
jgi:hypothetical protein